MRDDAKPPGGEGTLPAGEAPPETALGGAPRRNWVWSNLAAPWAISLIVHAWLLLVLALLLYGTATPRPGIDVLTASQAETGGEPVRSGTVNVAVETIDVPLAVIGAASDSADTQLTLEVEQDKPRPSAPVGFENLVRGDWMTPVAGRPGGLAGRRGANRARLVHERGGNEQSESAVELGLAWLAAHQLDDGSWRLNHNLAPQCKGLCRHPGNIGSTTAPTALALLPFLGAGYTHTDGKYRDVVDKGIYYLTSRMMTTPHGGDLQEGTMYAQGLSAIVLCEAYAMTGDEFLRGFAQAAVDFIVYAQHSGGGWRYLPGQAGDITSFGWQLMALKSAEMARLQAPSPTLRAASKFLDSVQADDGARYGYQRPDRTATTTAIGLLGRMYLGWPRDHKALARGAAFLEQTGPSATNLYYDYYATQVLIHLEGPGWDRWNTQLRDHLIATQAQQGHERGSWYFPDPKTKSAGRLYNTAMAVMTLEVYYRYLPLYTPQVLSGNGR